jgi:hypothetical protein
VRSLRGQPKCQSTAGALIADLVAKANLAGLFAAVRCSLARRLSTLDDIAMAMSGDLAALGGSSISIGKSNTHSIPTSKDPPRGYSDRRVKGNR